MKCLGMRPLIVRGLCEHELRWVCQGGTLQSSGVVSEIETHAGAGATKKKKLYDSHKAISRSINVKKD